MPVVAVSTTELPWQKVSGPLAVIFALPVVTFTTVPAEVAEHPLLFVTRTVYVPAVVTTFDCVVWLPGVQRYDVPGEDVSVTLPPLANVSGPLADMVAAGGWITVTVWVGAVPEPPITQPYWPEVVTRMFWVVAPLVHK